MASPEMSHLKRVELQEELDDLDAYQIIEKLFQLIDLAYKWRVYISYIIISYKCGEKIHTMIKRNGDDTLW
jgi:hypothetical protein